MKSLKLIGLVVLAVFSVASAEGQNHPDQTRRFQGAWFSIRYPASFHVVPSQHSRTSTTGYDSAFFTSSDSHVQFYVFSPQWNGDAQDYQRDAQREVLVDDRTEEKPQKLGYSKAHWVTVRARDKSYERSWVEVATPENTRLIFGIRYRNSADLRAYRPQYLAFKKSLVQFSD